MKPILCAATLLLASAGAHAAVAVGPISWITDTRRCTASFSGNGSGSSWQDRTTPFDAYQGGADIVATNGVETWTANCIQNSEMDAFGASYSATSHAVLIADVTSIAQLAQAQSKFDLWFSIDEPVAYELNGRLTESGHADSMGLVRLTALNNDVIELVTSSAETGRAFHRTGVLEPGTYRLYAEALGKCRTLPMIVFAEGDASCSFNFNVTPIGPEDPPPRPTRPSSFDGPPPRP
jgi:hypothetical protein